MKKILIVLVIAGKIWGEHKLNLNGGLGFMTRYIDINNDNITEYPKGMSYIIELFTIGRLNENDVSGILNFSYDKLNKTDIENIYISYERPSIKLEGGDVILDISERTIKNNLARGIKGGFLNKNIIFAFGILREKIEPSPTTAGQYRQYLGLVSKEGVFRNNSWRITYLQGEDDPASCNLPTINPIKNKVLEGSVLIPLVGRSLSFKSLLSFSEYAPNKRNKKNVEKDKAFEGGFSLNLPSLSVESLYSYIEPNFYTIGNLGLQNDYEGFKLNLQHRPKDKPFTGELDIEIYNDNIDKRKAGTKKTYIFNIKQDITPREFPELSIDYKRTNRKEDALPLEIENEISVGLSSSRIRNIDISGNYRRSFSDNKKQDEYDLKTSSYSLNINGKITRIISLSSFVSFISSKREGSKQDLSSYLLSLSFQPRSSLSFTPSYEHSKTKRDNIVLENRTLSLLLKWYLSTKYNMEIEYKNIENKENNYKGDSFGIKITSLF